LPALLRIQLKRRKVLQAGVHRHDQATPTLRLSSKQLVWVSHTIRTLGSGFARDWRVLVDERLRLALISTSDGGSELIQIDGLTQREVATGEPG